MKAIFKLKNTNRLQKQPPEVFCKKGVPKKFTKFTGKHLSHKNYHIKTSENLNSFKSIIKCWNVKHCTCRVCEHTISRQ